MNGTVATLFNAIDQGFIADSWDLGVRAAATGAHNADLKIARAYLEIVEREGTQPAKALINWVSSHDWGATRSLDGGVLTITTPDGIFTFTDLATLRAWAGY